MTSDLQSTGDVAPESMPPGAVLRVEAFVQDENQRLRKAASEALLSGALLCAEVDRGATQWTTKPDVQRFLKALEGLREALH